jgi:hypothetical protein
MARVVRETARKSASLVGRIAMPLPNVMVVLKTSSPSANEN